MSNIGVQNKELAAISEQIEALQKRRREIYSESTGEVVQDYQFKNQDGTEIRLSELFGDRDELIVVHNMGRRCTYCTLWADGFNGLWKHVGNRAPFIVISPDEPDIQCEFANSRGWTFPMASCAGSTFTKDMNMEEATGEFWPGISTFTKAQDGTIRRHAYSYLGPGDPFCSAWHMFDMLPAGENDWSPKYEY